jgi:hypothetical protein
MSYKSSTGRNVGKSLEIFQSDKRILGQGVGGGGAAAPTIKAISASGGTETTFVARDGNNYKVHTFTTVGVSTFTISANDPNATYYIQLQGGGAGGGGRKQSGESGPGGGGGGGSGHSAFFTVSSIPGSYPVIVGYGGSAGPSGGFDGIGAGNGGLSSLRNPQINITINGGSAGGNSSNQIAGPGGAGGSLLTLTPQPSSTIIYFGGSAVPGLRGNDDQSSGFNGAGGDLWTPIHYNPANLFFRSPDPVNGRGNGGPGQGGGSAGYARIYYQIPN